MKGSEAGRCQRPGRTILGETCDIEGQEHHKRTQEIATEVPGGKIPHPREGSEDTQRTRKGAS